MALGIFDRVRETTSVTGTGTATLSGAALGYESFAVVGDGNTTYYCIAGQGTAEWEVGIGTYTASGTTLARTTVISSSNANALVSFSAGSKDVFVTYPGTKGVYLDASGNAIGLGTPAAFTGTNITGTASSLSIGGNAATVTNGVYTTGSYANPTWITNINYSILNGTIPTWNQNTTGSSASCTGNAATVTNGVYTTGSYANPTWITNINYSILNGTIPTWNQNTTGSSASCTGNAATATTASALSATSWQNITGNAPTGSSYGSIAVSGVTGGYGGVYYSTQGSTFMVGANASGATGMYQNGTSSWQWYWQNVSGGESTLIAGLVPYGRLSGTVPTWNQNTTGSSAALSTASGSAPSYSARAWVNFNGQGTVAINASGNVSSITDNGVGRYQVNFTTNMQDINYCINTSTSGGVAGQFPGTPSVNSTINLTSRAPLVNNFTFYICAWNNTAVGIDEPWLMVSVHR
jgi:hypothetical protein